VAGTEIDNQDVAMRFAVGGLVLSGATNAVIGVLDAVAWAWWVTGVCLLAALLVAGAWSGPDGQRAARRYGGRAQQVQLVVGEVEPAALVRGHP
jgi:hypothetical protein